MSVREMFPLPGHLGVEMFDGKVHVSFREPMERGGLSVRAIPMTHTMARRLAVEILLASREARRLAKVKERAA